MANTHYAKRKFKARDPEKFQGYVALNEKFDGKEKFSEPYLKALIKGGYVASLTKVAKKSDVDPDNLVDETEGFENLGALGEESTDKKGNENEDSSNEENSDEDSEEGEGTKEPTEEELAELDEALANELGDDLEPNEEDAEAAQKASEQEDDDNPDGKLVEEEILSDTPITDAIHAAKGDREALKKIIKDNNADTSDRSKTENMYKYLLSEFEGK